MRALWRAEPLQAIPAPPQVQKARLDADSATADLLAASLAPLTLDEIAASFNTRGLWKKRLTQLLDMLVALGRAQQHGGAYSAM